VEPIFLFISSIMALIPLAAKMGEATEELAKHYGGHIGGLLNATFGNAAELIIALIAISNGLIELVKASITGSIIGNLLFVLGASLFVGGLKYKEQKFSSVISNTNATMLLIAFLSLMIPSLFDIFPEHTLSKEINLSLIIAVLLIIVYISSLIFSLKTHKYLFAQKKEKKEEIPTMSKRDGILTLIISTILLGLMSEVLVGQVEIVASQFGLGEIFIGAVVVAIVGNVAEHLSSMNFAIRNKMDIAMNITVGSSLQIALFVAPILVIVGVLVFGQPMDFVFSPFEIIAVFSSVIVVNEISNDGKSNWFEGLQLLVMYLIIAALFYFI